MPISDQRKRTGGATESSVDMQIKEQSDTPSRPSGHATGHDLHDLFRNVFALHASLSSAMDSVHEHSGLRTPQVRVANRLSHGPATVPHVATDLAVSRQYVQTVCNELQEQGLMEFVENPRHKRSKLVALTEKGQKALAQTRENEAALIQQSLPDICSQQVTEASTLLKELRERIEETRFEGSENS